MAKRNNGSSNDGMPRQEVEDKDGHLKRQRLNDIHEARQRVHDAINKIEEARLGQKIPQQRANAVIRRAVANYIREIRYPLKTTDEGRTYWEDQEIGTFEIPAPSPATLAWQHKERKDIGHSPQDPTKTKLPPEYKLRGNPDLSPTKVKLVGLKSIFDAPNPIRETYSLTFHIRFQGTVTVEETVERQLPRDVLLEFFDQSIEASGEIGLEATLEDDSGDGGFDLDDLDDVDFDLTKEEDGGEA